MSRITEHPVLEIPKRPVISFTFNGREITACAGEVITSALIASGIHVFSHHHKGHAPQGLFCANGQCSQCMVLVDGVPVKGCMTRVRPGMTVTGCKGRYTLPADDTPAASCTAPCREVDCLIIGGGPAGLSAAAELGKAGVDTLVVDDKHTLGGKLTLQTHQFFGSRSESFAGKRGMEIANLLEEEVRGYPSVEVWLESPAVGIFSDKKAGVVRGYTLRGYTPRGYPLQGGPRKEYTLVQPRVVLVAAGARERSLAFPGCDLPGVFGAGAFQTLVNRDLVVPSKRLFILGGGNVGLIVGYHALQAGIEVTGLAELLPVVGGYKVHADKLQRLGVPVYTSHTIVAAAGTDHLSGITICEVDRDLKPIAGREKTFPVDTLLIAVGLNPIDDMFRQADELGMEVYAAGDAEEIAEAGAALVSGRIRGQQIVESLTGRRVLEEGWQRSLEPYRRGPGKVYRRTQNYRENGIYPVIWCNQEIPCDPCSLLCPRGDIELDGEQLMGIPVYTGHDCSGCSRCVLECPGLAIVLIDETQDRSNKTAVVTLPYEFLEGRISEGDTVVTTGYEGDTVGTGRVIAVTQPGRMKRALLKLEIPYEDRLSVAGFRLLEGDTGRWDTLPIEGGETVVCRCERVMKKEVVQLIHAGYRDMNHIKAVLRTGMGACGGKSCKDLILNIFREEGIPEEEIVPFVYRAPDLEIPLGLCAGDREGGGDG